MWLYPRVKGYWCNFCVELMKWSWWEHLFYRTGLSLKWAIGICVWLLFQEIWRPSSKSLAGESSSTDATSMAATILDDAVPQSMLGITKTVHHASVSLQEGTCRCNTSLGHVPATFSFLSKCCDFVPATCPHYTSLLLVPATRPCCMSLLQVPSTRPCCMSLLHVPAACPCYTLLLHVPSTRPCCTSVPHVPATCPRYTSSLHVPLHVPATCRLIVYFPRFCRCSMVPRVWPCTFQKKSTPEKIRALFDLKSCFYRTRCSGGASKMNLHFDGQVNRFLFIFAHVLRVLSSLPQHVSFSETFKRRAW